MTIEENPDLYKNIYPDCFNFYQQQLSALSNMTLVDNSNSGHPFEVFAGGIMRYVRELSNFDPDPLKNWYGPEIARNMEFYDAQCANERTGILNPTVFPVIEEILRANNLWNDPIIKMFVICHLRQRRSINLRVEFPWMEDYFFRQYQERHYSQDHRNIQEVRDFIYFLADMAGEVVGQRKIHFAQNASISAATRGLKYCEITPMNSQQWQQFLSTSTGKQIGISSTVLWFIEESQTISDTRSDKPHGSRCYQALQHHQQDPIYKSLKLEKPPYPYINQHIKEFLAQSSS